MLINHSKFRSSLVSCSLVAILAIFSQIFVPLPFTPITITLQTLALMICALVQPPREVFITVSIYLLLGAVGVPVFAGFRGGPSHLIGPTGGFLLAFLPATAFLSYLISKAKKSNLLYLVLPLIGFHIIVYLLGSLWFMKLTGNSFQQTLVFCVLPFLLGDALKTIVFVLAYPQLSRLRRK